MDKDDFIDIIGTVIVVAGTIALLIVSGLKGRSIGIGSIQKQAIEHGAAYYHEKTGEFTWRNVK